MCPPFCKTVPNSASAVLRGLMRGLCLICRENGADLHYPACLSHTEPRQALAHNRTAPAAIAPRPRLLQTAGKFDICKLPCFIKELDLGRFVIFVLVLQALNQTKHGPPVVRVKFQITAKHRLLVAHHHPESAAPGLPRRVIPERWFRIRKRICFATACSRFTAA